MVTIVWHSSKEDPIPPTTFINVDGVTFVLEDRLLKAHNCKEKYIVLKRENFTNLRAFREMEKYMRARSDNRMLQDGLRWSPHERVAGHRRQDTSMYKEKKRNQERLDEMVRWNTSEDIPDFSPEARIAPTQKDKERKDKK
jgi:hypothetical protein